MTESNETRVTKLLLEIERRLSDAQHLNQLLTNAQARVRQLREELAHVRSKHRQRSTGRFGLGVPACPAKTTLGVIR